jgi:hypothetical protein
MRLFKNFFYTLSFCKTFTNSLYVRFLSSDSIVFSISSQPFNYQCNENILNLDGLRMEVLCSVNKNSFRIPASETGLPVIDMSWYVNGNPTNLTSFNTFNIEPVTYSGNVWSFGLLDAQHSIGGTVQLGNCVQGQQYSIQASFSTNSFIIGTGIPQFNIPAVNGVPIIQNNLSPINLYTNQLTTLRKTTTLSPSTKFTSTTTLSPSTKSTSTSKKTDTNNNTITNTPTLSRMSNITTQTNPVTSTNINLITTTPVSIENNDIIYISIGIMSIIIIILLIILILCIKKIYGNCCCT